MIIIPNVEYLNMKKIHLSLVNGETGDLWKNLEDFRSVILCNKIHLNVSEVKLHYIVEWFNLISEIESESSMRFYITWSSPLRYYALCEYNNLIKLYEKKFRIKYR